MKIIKIPEIPQGKSNKIISKTYKINEETNNNLKELVKKSGMKEVNLFEFLVNNAKIERK